MTEAQHISTEAQYVSFAEGESTTTFVINGVEPAIVDAVGVNETIGSGGIVYGTRKHAHQWGNPVHGTGRWAQPHICQRHPHHRGACNCFCGSVHECSTRRHP